ncbi:MAG: rhomboid family intramembrane serine protease [Myxococcota bacterium]|nr:rhomboid family intramembrane serine protease [Myxococcota bacterium]
MDPCQNRRVLPLRDHLPARTVPIINYALISMSVAGFVLERTALGGGVEPSDLLEQWGLVPARLLVDPVVTIETVFTSMFMHDPTNLMHIGGNMLFLWIFGDNVEAAMGHIRYLAFYLLGGVSAAAAQILVDPTSTIPMVGASGAISAVLAAYVFLYPRSPITVINPIPLLWLFWGIFLYFPAWLVIGEFFVANLWSALASTSSQGGVAFVAHVGGFIAGAVLWRTFLAGRPRLDDYGRWQQWARPSRTRERWP